MAAKIDLPLVLVNNKDEAELRLARSKSHKTLSSSLNYEILEEIAELKRMKEESALIPELLRERFLLTYPKIFHNAEKPKEKAASRHSMKAVSARGLSARSGAVASPSRALMLTYPRLENLSKPKKNFEVENENVRMGFVPQMHDLTYHLSQLHDIRASISFQQRFELAIKDLRNFLGILPFERTTDELTQIAQAFVDMKSPILKLVPRKHLKDIAGIATLEVYKEEDMTIFGNQGLFMVLKGQLHPLTLPVLKKKNDDIDEVFRQPTPLLSNPNEFTIGVGECFGTLEPLPNRQINSRVLSLSTRYPGTELMKISVSSYKSLMEKLRTADKNEKVTLLRKCPQYSQWPQMSLEEIASVLQWVKVPQGQTLVKENSIAPFIAIVSSGCCSAFRTIDTMHKLSTGQRERRKKKVLIGKLESGSSFGEISLIEHDWITCSITTTAPTLLAIISPEKLADLNPVTVSLIHQSNKPTFGDISTDWLKEEYIQRESTREWELFRNQIVKLSITQNQINPGSGKWSVPESQISEAKVLCQKD